MMPSPSCCTSILPLPFPHDVFLMLHNEAFLIHTDLNIKFLLQHSKFFHSVNHQIMSQYDFWLQILGQKKFTQLQMHTWNIGNNRKMFPLLTNFKALLLLHNIERSLYSQLPLPIVYCVHTLLGFFFHCLASFRKIHTDTYYKSYILKSFVCS